MAEKFIFTMLGLNKYYGQKQVLKDIGLCFFPGAKIGIVGPNGSGKSTVLRIMAGLDDDFQGQAQLSKGYRAGIVLQDPVLDDSLAVRQTIESAFGETQSLLKEYEDLSIQLAEPMDDDAMQAALDRMGELQDKLDAADAWSLDVKLNQASEALVLPDDDRVVRSLSGGERRRVALCKALLEQPDLLLLDEPTNHLDAETVDWLEAQLRDYPGTVIIVTHDRYFLDNITKWILELDNGEGIPYEGNYTSWLEQKLSRLVTDEKKDSPRGRALARELSWIRMSNKDRHQLAQSRVAEFEKLVAQETSAARDDGATIQIAPGPELGDQVIAFDKVAKSYDGAPIFQDVSFQVPKGAIVGVVGPNGAGKTTLIRLLVGEEISDAGSIAVGPTVQFAYVPQDIDLSGESVGLVDAISEGVPEIALGNRSVPVRQYLARFGFRGADQQKTVNQLSGGERNRYRLAKVLKTGGNVLLLDEPTNDLDVNTLRMLEEALLGFPGCAMVVSHDRFFLDRICTHLLVFEGDGQVRWFTGNYREYEEWRAKELGGDVFANRRKRYHSIITR